MHPGHPQEISLLVCVSLVQVNWAGRPKRSRTGQGKLRIAGGGVERMSDAEAVTCVEGNCSHRHGGGCCGGDPGRLMGGARIRPVLAPIRAAPGCMLSRLSGHFLPILSRGRDRWRIERTMGRRLLRIPLLSLLSCCSACSALQFIKSKSKCSGVSKLGKSTMWCNRTQKVQCVFGTTIF